MNRPDFEVVSRLRDIAEIKLISTFFNGADFGVGAAHSLIDLSYPGVARVAVIDDSILPQLALPQVSDVPVNDETYNIIFSGWHR